MANTAAVLDFLQAHPAVAWVVHPSLPEHPDHALAAAPAAQGRRLDRQLRGQGRPGRGRPVHRGLPPRLASGQCRRRQDAGHPPGLDHPRPARPRAAGRRRPARRHDPPLGRAGAPGRHHRRPRPCAARRAEGLSDGRLTSPPRADRFAPTHPPRCSSTAPAWTTRSGRCRAATSPSTAGTRWPSTCPATAARAHLPPPGSIEAIADGLAELIGAGAPGHAGRPLHGRARRPGHRCPPSRAGRGLVPARRRRPDAGPSRPPGAGRRPRPQGGRADVRLGVRPARPDRRQPASRRLAAGHRPRPAAARRPGRLEHRPRRLQRLRRRPRARGSGPLPDPGRDRRLGPHDPAQSRPGAGGGDPGARVSDRRARAT